MHTLHETFWGRTNRVAGEGEGYRAAKSNGVMKGDGQRPLHTAMGAGDRKKRRRSRKEAETPEGRREHQLRGAGGAVCSKRKAGECRSMTRDELLLMEKKSKR